MSSVAQLRQLTWVRILMFLREPEAMFWVFLFPVVLALVLGLAFKNRGTETVQIGVIENTLAPHWEAALDAHEGLRIVRYQDTDEANRKLRAGAIAAIVSGQDEVVLRLDPTRPEGDTALLRLDDALQEAAGRVDPITIKKDEVRENGSRYIDFLIPGLLGMNLMGTGIWGTGFAVVDMRQKKLLKLFLVTPMRKTWFLLAQICSRFLFLVVEVVVIVAFGVFVFDVPFRGSPVMFGALSLLGGASFAGLGLLIASRAQTIEGVSGIMNFVMMPMWLLSGVFFSYEKFPEVLHPFIRMLPLTALNDGLRLIMLEGESGSKLLPIFVAQLAWGGVAFLIALRVFRWR